MFEKNEFNLMEYLLVNIDYETEFEIISNPKTSYSNLLLTGEFNFDGNLLFNAKFFAKRTNVKIATVVLQIIDSEKESESFPKTAVEIKKLKVVGNGEIKFKVGTLCNFWKINNKNNFTFYSWHFKKKCYHKNRKRNLWIKLF